MRGLDGGGLERRLDDHPGQSHAADRRPEQRGVVGAAAIGRERPHRAVRRHQRHRPQVRAERAVDVMVLAVDVSRDRAADGHVPRPGRHRHEPAQREQVAHQRLEAQPGRRRDEPGVGVDDPVASESGDVEDVAARDLGGVAVRASEPARDHAAPARAGEQGPHVVDRLRPVHGGRGRGGAAPAGQQSRRRALRWHRCRARSAAPAGRRRPAGCGRAAPAPRATRRSRHPRARRSAGSPSRTARCSA